MTRKEIAQSFSSGSINSIEAHLANNIRWTIYEASIDLNGKQAVIDFGNSVTQYFQTLTTEFSEYGILEENNRIAIYGHASFIKDGVIVNTVNSCDVYEFDSQGNIAVAHSYCNSRKPND